MASNISVVLTIDNTQYISDLKKAESATNSFATSTQAGADRAANSIRGLDNTAFGLNSTFQKLATLVSGAALIGFARTAYMMADAIVDLSNSTGVAIPYIEGLNGALITAGGGAESASRGLETFLLKVDEASQGSLKLQNAFADLGITLNDLKTLTEQQLFDTVVRRLAEMPTSAQKTALQMELLGKAFRGVTIDRSFVENLDAGAESARANEESLKAAAKTVDEFQKAVKNLQTAFLTTFGPAVKALSDFSLNADNARKIMQVLGAVIVGALGAAAMGVVANAVVNVIRLARAFQAAAVAATAMQAATGIGIAKLAAGAVAAGIAYKALGDSIDAAVASAESIPGVNTGASGAAPGQTPAVAGNQQEAASVREVVDATARKREQIQALAQDYQRASNRLVENIEQETRLIGASRLFVDQSKAQSDSVRRMEDEIKKLVEAKRNLTDEEKRAGLEAKYDEQIAKIREISAVEQDRLRIAIEARNVTDVTDKVRQYGLNRELELSKQVRDIQNEVASMFLPELERRYRAVTQAADESARAQVANLAQQQNMSVSEFTRTYPEQVAAVYRAAAAGVRELNEAERARFAAQGEQRQLNFELQNRIKYEQDLQRILDDQAKLGLSEIEKKYYDIGAAARDSAQARIRAEEQARFGAQAGTAPEFTLAGTDPAMVARITQEANRGADELRRQTEALYESSRRFETGWNRAFREYADNASNAAKNAESIFTKATKGMEDAIVNFAKTGKFEWKGFVNSILEELLRQQVRQTIASVFGATGLGGGGNNSGGSFLGGLLGFANGGIIPTNAPVLVGERGPELISGAAGRFVTPNNQLGGTNVTYNIQAVDALSFRQMVARDPGFIHAVASTGGKSVPVRR